MFILLKCIHQNPPEIYFRAVWVIGKSLTMKTMTYQIKTFSYSMHKDIRVAQIYNVSTQYRYFRDFAMSYIPSAIETGPCLPKVTTTNSNRYHELWTKAPGQLICETEEDISCHSRSVRVCLCLYWQYECFRATIYLLRYCNQQRETYIPRKGNIKLSNHMAVTPYGA